MYPDNKLPIAGCGLTSAGALAAQYLIHSRPPVYENIPNHDNKDKTMSNAMRMTVYTILETARVLKTESVGMPPICSAPLELCAKTQI